MPVAKEVTIEHYRHQQQCSTAIVGGCRVGHQDPKTRKLVGKEWCIESMSKEFADNFHLPCLQHACSGAHTACAGYLTRASAFYTPKFAKRAVHFMCKIPNPDMSPNASMLNMRQCQCRVFTSKG